MFVFVGAVMCLSATGICCQSDLNHPAKTKQLSASSNTLSDLSLNLRPPSLCTTNGRLSDTRRRLPCKHASHERVQRVNITQRLRFPNSFNRSSVSPNSLCLQLKSMKRYQNILTMPDALSTKVKQPLQAQSKLRISSFIGLCTLLVRWNKHKHLRGI